MHSYRVCCLQDMRSETTAVHVVDMKDRFTYPYTHAMMDRGLTDTPGQKRGSCIYIATHS